MVQRYPDQFGSHRVIRRVGHGGMGVVYLAQTADGRQIAIKSLEEMAHFDLHALRALRREVQLLTELAHPNIVGVVDADLDGEPPWYAMEYVDGQSLADLIASDPETAATVVDTPAPTVQSGEEGPAVHGRGVASWDNLTRTALTWLAQVAHALAYMHGRGLIHGDLKPQNIVVSGTRAVLIDFGLAQQIEGRIGLDGLRRARSSARTPAYAAPESFGSERLDPRADLYSLGCVIYEIVAGSLPFEGTPLQVMMAHRREEPPTLSASVSDVPEALDELVQRLLAKQPADRPAHALDIVSTLASIGVESPSADGLPSVNAYLYPAPIVGRGDEIDEVVSRACDVAGGNGAILILGESGVGKSTLALEAIKAGRDRKCRIVTTTGKRLRPTSSREPTIPFSGMTGVFDEIVDFARTSSPGDVARVLEHDVLFLAPFDTRLRPWCDRESPVPKDPIGAACRSLKAVLSRMCELNGLLFVCDEVQWLDPASFQVFEELIVESTEHPWLVIGLARSEELELAESGPVAEACDVVELGRLTPEQTGETVAGILGLDAVDAQVARLVHDRCGGNPYYVREFLSLALQERALMLDGAGCWVGRNGVSLGTALIDVPDPESVVELTRRRVNALSRPVDRVVRHAAVIGREFAIEVLDSAMTELEGSVLDRALNELRELEFIEPVGTPATMRFVHDRLRETVLEELSEEQVRDTHAAVARGLASRGGDEAIIAWHYEQAGLMEAATERWLQSVEQARTRQAMGTVASRLRHAVRAGETVLSTSRRQRLRCERLRALVQIKSHDIVIEEAQKLLQEDLAVDTRGRALSHLAQSLWMTGDPDDAVEAAEQALQLLDRDAEPDAFASALITRADALDVSGNESEAIDLFREALNLADAHDVTPLVLRAQNNLGLTYLGLGQNEQAHRWLKAGLETARASGNRWIEAILCANMGRLFTELARYEEAKNWFRGTLEISTELGQESLTALAHQGLGQIDLERGDFPGALRFFALAERYFRQVGMSGVTGFNLINRACVLTRQGAYEAALYTAQRGLELVQGDFVGDEIYALHTIGRARMEMGETRRALDLIRQAYEMACSRDSDRVAAFTAIDASLAATFSGAYDDALRWAELGRQGAESLLPDAAFARGLALRRAGHPEEAIDSLISAYRGSSEMGRRWNAALAAAETSIAVHAAGRPEARRWLEIARQLVGGLEIGDTSLPKRSIAQAERTLASD